MHNNRIQISHSSYRYDVDSLRAFAIIPVVLFHAGFSFLPGGFIGVDIFFVISGFLITGIIVKEIGAGNFSIARFYERRARRIIPALTLTIAATLAIGWLLLKPEEIDALSKSAIAAIGFSSNIWFWRSSLEYFGPDVDLAPLLHTWSLSVEEQFYIFFPLMLIAIRKAAPNHLGRLIFLVTILSFGLSCYLVYIKPSATFYLLPTRAWELGLGSLLAIYAQKINSLLTGDKEVLSIVGLGLLFAPMFLYSKSLPFPGLLALAPCLGAAILIAVGAKSPARILTPLRWPVLVFVGKISYSLYLVHWPIIVFVKYLSNKTAFSLTTAVLVVFVSLLCAIASWRYVEQPFRNSRHTRRQIFAFSGASMGLVVATAASLILFDSIKFQLSEEQQKIVQAASDRAKIPLNCKPIVQGEGLCPIGSVNTGEKPYDFALIGDSHALSISKEISDSAASMGHSGLMMSLICPPLLDVTRFIEPRCTEFIDVVLRSIIARTDIRTVILHARWAYYESGTDIDGNTNDENYKLLLVRDTLDKNGADPHAIFERGLRKTVELLLESGRKVVIIEGVPEVGWDVPNAMLTKSRWGLPTPSVPSVETVAARQQGARAVFDQFRMDPRVQFVDPMKVMCGGIECMYEVDGLPAYYDDNHLTIAASRSFFREIFVGEIFRRH